ncbi:MAG: FG-GAP repeat domain-containing protein, partial [Thermoanaerobaculia bacterium]
MKGRFGWFLGGIPVLAAVLAAAGCSSSSPAPKAEAAPAVPVGFQYEQPKAKTDPDVVEETDTYYVRRYKKSDMVRVDATHVRPPFFSEKLKLPIYREDANYYYIRTEKYSPEEIEAARKEREEKDKEKEQAREKAAKGASVEAGAVLTDADFDSIVPARAKSGVRLVRAGGGLPEGGQWRQNIAVADLNGDGFPDIVASPDRVSSGATFYLFLGDGRGNFREQEPVIVEADGKPAKTNTGYGGVAVADFDGDGKPDIAVDSHEGGVHVFLQRKDFHFTPMDKGLPAKFSSQGIAAFDVDGDGKIDLIVSRDQPEDMEHQVKIDYHQVRVYRNHLPEEWKYDEKA